MDVDYEKQAQELFGRRVTLLDRVQFFTKKSIYTLTALSALTGALGFGYSQIPTSQEYLLKVDVANNITRGTVCNVFSNCDLEFEVYHTDGEKGFPKSKEGDRKTPIGSYQVAYWKDDKAILNYPNQIDSQYGRTGGAIQILSTNHYKEKEKRVNAILQGKDATNGSIQYLPKDYKKVKSFLENGATIDIGVFR